MTIREYQEAVKRTCATTEPAETMKLALIGLQDEPGEVAGPIKKHLWHQHELDVEHVQDEIGDILWYLATLSNALDITLEDAVEGNVKKLLKRYPDGFSSERSINRASSAGSFSLREEKGQ